jgi:sec-independent protein translocase protein TatC
MSVLEHLDELRSRLFKILVAYVLVLVACWFIKDPVLGFLLEPIRETLPPGEKPIFTGPTEAFSTFMKAIGLVAVFISAPYILYQVWAFIVPGLYRREKRMVLPFLFFGSLFFFAGGAFAYYIALPRVTEWLINLGTEIADPEIKLREALPFVSKIVLGMGLIFELPIMIFFLSRLGLVTPGSLMRHFRVAILVIAVLAAVLSPSGDPVNMLVFALPMVALYLLGVAVSWIFAPRDRGESE